MRKIAALAGIHCAIFFCLSLSLTDAIAAENPRLSSEVLKTYGFSTEQSLETIPCIFRLVLDQTTFNEIMPLLLEKRMLGNGQSLEFANRHLVGMENVWSISMMAALVQQTYRLNPKLDRCRFEGHLLIPDDYGHAQDKLAYSFDFDRALFRRIDWDRMESRSLTKVAKHFRFSDWVSHEVGKEQD